MGLLWSKEEEVQKSEGVKVDDFVVVKDEEKLAAEKAEQERQQRKLQEQEEQVQARSRAQEKLKLNKAMGVDPSEQEAAKQQKKAQADQLKDLKDQSVSQNGGYANQHRQSIQQPRGQNHR